jgi:hypothetical protein
MNYDKRRSQIGSNRKNMKLWSYESFNKGYPSLELLYK